MAWLKELWIFLRFVIVWPVIFSLAYATLMTLVSL